MVVEQVVYRVRQERSANSEMRDQLREMESTLQWRDNKIKALEAHRDYFMKKAQQPILLSRAQVHSVPKTFAVNIAVDIKGAFQLPLFGKN